jgi:hypothetical protein
MFLMSALTMDNEFQTEPESVKGFNLLEDRFPNRDAVSELVVVRSETGSVQDPQFQAAVKELRADIAAAEAVRGVGHPMGAAPRGWCRRTAPQCCFR